MKMADVFGFQDRCMDVDLESRHFVLVHGGGLGAWCWYKSIALLENSGFKATAVDLMGSGIEPTDPNRVTSLVHYSKPLLDLLKKIKSTAGHEKVKSSLTSLQCHHAEVSCCS